MAASGRKRAYTVPVAVQLDFAVTQNDPPAIHTLAKNYLDVLQKVEPSEAIGRRMLLLKDDRQVQCLVCNYQLRPRNAEPGVQIRVASMANLVADLELYERVRRGNFSDTSGPNHSMSVRLVTVMIQKSAKGGEDTPSKTYSSG